MMRAPLVAFGMLAGGVHALCAQGEDYLGSISLDSLLSIQVSSVSRYAQRVMDAPGAITIITAEEMERFGDRTLDQVLARVGGMYTTSDRNYTYIGVRGFSRPTDYNNRVVLLLNGRVLNEAYYGSIPAGTDFPLDFGVVERVEVLRGPASALYGGGAMLALVNVVTRAGADLEGMGAVVEVGSGGAREAAVHGGFSRGRAQLVFGARAGAVAGEDRYYPEFDGPETNHGVAENLDWDEYRSVFAALSLGSARLQLLSTTRAKGIPTAAWGAQFNDPRAETRDGWHLAELSLDHEWSPTLRTAVAAWFHGYNYLGFYPYETLSEDGTRVRTLGMDMRGTLDLNPGNRLVAGVEAIRHLKADYRLWDSTGFDFRGDFPYGTGALYVQDEQSLGARLSVTAGARLDVSSETHPRLSPRLAAVYRFSDEMTAKLLAATAFRPPNPYEREFFSEGFPQASHLEAEQIKTLELSLERRVSSWLYARVAGFFYDMEDLIDTMQRPDGSTQFANYSDVESRGIEVDLRADAGAWSGYARYSGLRAVVEQGSSLSNSPDHLLKAGVAADLPHGVSPALELQYIGKRWTLERLQHLNAALLFNATLRLRPAPRWAAGVRARNLLDSEYAVPAGYEHVMRSIRQDGRTLSVFAEYRWP